MKRFICLIKGHRWVFLHTVSTFLLDPPKPPVIHICTRCGKHNNKLFPLLGHLSEEPSESIEN